MRDPRAVLTQKIGELAKVAKECEALKLIIPLLEVPQDKVQPQVAPPATGQTKAWP